MTLLGLGALLCGEWHHFNIGLSVADDDDVLAVAGAIEEF